MKPENFHHSFSPIDCRFFVIIKSLNEEMQIPAATKNELRSVRRVGVEVILANLFSTNKTIEMWA